MESDADTTVVPDEDDEEVTENYQAADPATEVIVNVRTRATAGGPAASPHERRFTAPGFDAKETAIINAANDPATEVFEPGQAPSRVRAEPTENRYAAIDSTSARRQIAAVHATQLGLGTGGDPDRPGAGRDRRSSALCC